MIDYKNSNARKELQKIAASGIDIYFDNVGGPLLEAVLFQINLNVSLQNVHPQ